MHLIHIVGESMFTKFWKILTFVYKVVFLQFKGFKMFTIFFHAKNLNNFFFIFTWKLPSVNDCY
jgi:hypothetical protein